jgi:hypothetical protein
MVCRAVSPNGSRRVLAHATHAALPANRAPVGTLVGVAGERWRIALITTVPPLAEILVSTLRHLGHDPVAVISARRDRPRPGQPSLGDETAPKGLDLYIPRDKWSIEPMMRAINPDLAICSGYPWRIPLTALNVPRIGSINWHPRCCRAIAARSRWPGRSGTATASSA